MFKFFESLYYILPNNEIGDLNRESFYWNYSNFISVIRDFFRGTTSQRNFDFMIRVGISWLYKKEWEYQVGKT